MHIAQGNPTFPEYVRMVFDACTEALLRLRLRERYGDDLFIAMGAADPTRLLECEERRFIEKANTTEMFEMWLRDFA
jgi:hypothetical protein